MQDRTPQETLKEPVAQEPTEVTPEQLDEVSGGNGGSSVHRPGGPPAPTP